MLIPRRSCFPFRRASLAIATGRVWANSALLTLAAAAVIGCANEQPPSLVRLEISANGTYFVDGLSVEKSALAAALSSKRRPNAELFVHVIPLPGSNYDAVHGAMEAAQRAGAKIGMVGNERF